MTRDPFRALDPVEPPDQWADIAARAAAPRPDVGDLVPRHRARALVAAAAVLALLGGGVALATAGDDGADVAAGPTTEGAGAPDPCPFDLDGRADVPRLEPGRVAGSPTLDGTEGAGARHGSVDGWRVEVDVRAGAARSGAYVAVAPDAQRWVLHERPVPAPRPGCEVVVVAVERVDQDEDRLAAEVERIADAVRLLDEVEEGAGCSVALDDPALPALTPKAEGEEVTFELLDDVTDSWLRTEAEGAVVFVGVGARPIGPVEAPGVRWVSEEADFTTGPGPPRAMVRANEGLAADGPCTDAVVHVLFPLTAAEVEALEAGTLAQPDITDEVALAERVLDALLVDGEPVPDAPPFAVREEPGRGLCARLGGTDLGCDDEGPVLAPGADPSTPRLAVDGCCPPVWYGYLPAEGTPVLLDRDGTVLPVEAVVQGDIWFLPVPVEHADRDLISTTTEVAYRQADGTLDPAPTP